LSPTDTSVAAVPQRTCVGCRAVRPQAQLVRWVLASDGSPRCSRTAAGRGAWLCADASGCLQLALKRRGFERAWKRPIPTSTTQALQIAYEAMTTNMEN